MDLFDKSMAKRLKICPMHLYGFCVEKILEAGVDGMTYDEKALQLIQDGEILPNEQAYLAVAGIHYLMLLMEAEDKIQQEKV